MANLNVKISFIGLLDMLKFKKMAQVRDEAIEAAEAKEIAADYPINKTAKKLHPDYQDLFICEIENHENAGAKTYWLKRKGGGSPAMFRAGQYLSLKLNIGDSAVTRPYSISSTPKESLDGKVAITIKTNPGGFAADWILKNFKEGDRVVTSDPQGLFYYEELRDAKNVIALAGGSGITPFLSMAGAIVEGSEDFNLTILFGSRTEDSILYKDKLESLAEASNGKVKIVHVLSDEKLDGYENGFITADLVKKYAPQDEEYSVFVCGPEAMYRFLDGEIAKLDLPLRLVRRELQGVTKNVAAREDYKGDSQAVYNITVHQAGQDTRVVPANASETVLVALERAGIKAPSRCRSGECGWCRSQLVKGDVYIPEETDGRRHADKTNGLIHPCASFPLSDLEMEVPGEIW